MEVIIDGTSRGQAEANYIVTINYFNDAIKTEYGEASSFVYNGRDYDMQDVYNEGLRLLRQAHDTGYAGFYYSRDGVTRALDRIFVTMWSWTTIEWTHVGEGYNAAAIIFHPTVTREDAKEYTLRFIEG